MSERSEVGGPVYQPAVVPPRSTPASADQVLRVCGGAAEYRGVRDVIRFETDHIHAVGLDSDPIGPDCWACRVHFPGSVYTLYFRTRQQAQAAAAMLVPPLPEPA